MELLSFIFIDNSIRIVDLNFLKQCEYLNEARVFKYLLDLDKNCPFKTKCIEKDENGNINLFQKFKIESSEWDLLIHFLRHGYTESYYSGSKYTQQNNLDKTDHICDVIGGIPAFDIFYKKHTDKIIKNYNPMSPRDDYLMKYNWQVMSCYHFNKLEEEKKIDWHVTTPISRERENNNYLYYRKLK